MIRFIVNPAAGGGRASSYINEIERHMDCEFEVRMTSAPMDAARLAKEAAADAGVVVAVGGDGTIHEAVSGLVGTDAVFGVIPCGSGNDFIKSAGIDSRMPVNKYLEIIKGGRIKAVDLIRMNGFYFANIGSVGIDAEIARTAARLKKTLGGLSYVAAALYCSLTYSATRMRVSVDGSESTDELTLAAICNGWNYGGGFKIAPNAKNDDGQITVCMIDKMSKPAMVFLFPSVLVAKHTGLKQVRFCDCKEISIDYDGVRKVNLDGNIYELSGPLNFSILPGALRLLC